MGIPSPVQQTYDEWNTTLVGVQKVAGGTLNEWAGKHGYPFIDRVKSVDSVSEKIESGRYEHWLELDDLYAATVVVPGHSAVQEVVDFLGTAFDLHDLKIRTTIQKPPDVFRFDDTRWYGTLREDSAAGLPQGAGDLLFEVQIRTAFEHAWIVATHDFSYKSDGVDWARLRMAASLRASVEQLDLLVAQLPAIADTVEASPHASTEARERIHDVFRDLLEHGLILPEHEPASWSRFVDNLMSLVRSIKKGDVPRRSIKFASDIANVLHDSDPDELPLSISLFQLVIGVAVEHDLLGPDPLTRHVVVGSQELADIYGIRTVPKPFTFR